MVKFLFLLLCILSFSASASQVMYMPQEITVEKHEYFEIDIIVSPSEYIDTVGINKIEWDSRIIVLDRVIKGDFYPSPLVWIEGTRGKSNLTWMCMASQETTNSQGIIATLKFRAREDGETYITSDSTDVDLVLAGERKDVSVQHAKVIVGTGVYPSNVLDIPVNYIIFFLIIVIAAFSTFLIFKHIKKSKPLKKRKKQAKSEKHESELETDIFS